MSLDVRHEAHVGKLEMLALDKIVHVSTYALKGMGIMLAQPHNTTQHVLSIVTLRLLLPLLAMIL